MKVLFLLSGFGAAYSMIAQQKIYVPHYVQKKYFGSAPLTPSMQDFLERVESRERAVQVISKKINQQYRGLPDLTYIPHSFKKSIVSWDDLESALNRALLHMNLIKQSLEKIEKRLGSDDPRLLGHKIDEKWTRKTIEDVLEGIRKNKKKALEREEKQYEKYVEFSGPPSWLFPFARMRWQTTRPMQPTQQIEQLD